MDFAPPITCTRRMMPTQRDNALAGAVAACGAGLARVSDAVEGSLVVVQREWNGWRTALTRLVDLEHVHWLQPSGAPRRLIHAYVPCTKLQSGNIPHECDEPSAPHRLLVCILKCHTAPGVFEALSRDADDRERSLLPLPAR
jgi:hypothetical protein